MSPRRQDIVSLVPAIHYLCPMLPPSLPASVLTLSYKVVRGALDLHGVAGRVSARSKYGVKKPKKN